MFLHADHITWMSSSYSKGFIVCIGFFKRFNDPPKSEKPFLFSKLTHFSQLQPVYTGGFALKAHGFSSWGEGGAL